MFIFLFLGNMPLTPAERQRNYRERMKANKPEIWDERKKLKINGENI